MSVIFIRIETLQTYQRPGMRIADVLRYITPRIENMAPLANGSALSPISREVIAEWTVVDSLEKQDGDILTPFKKGERA